MRADPRVSLTVMDLANWGAHVSLQGRVVSRRTMSICATSTVSRGATGDAYPIREDARTSAWIEVEHWHAWRPENL